MRLTTMKINYWIIFLIGLTVSATSSALDLNVDSPTIKAPRPGQNISAGFVKLISTKDLLIDSIKSENISKIEVHTMKMEKSTNGETIMRMRKIEKPLLKANKAFILQPGADHLMFFGIQNTLSKGEKIKVTFNFLEKAQIVSKDIIFEVR